MTHWWTRAACAVARVHGNRASCGAGVAVSLGGADSLFAAHCVRHICLSCCCCSHLRRSLEGSLGNRRAVYGVDCGLLLCFCMMSVSSGEIVGSLSGHH